MNYRNTRSLEIQARKDRVLCVTIEQYIKSVTPVSSACLAKECSLDVSSATIRNVLADLEQDGFLTHPHTSAGRIPTEMGYRYYVDNLMNEIQLLENEKDKIKTEYKKASNELEMLLEKTSQVLSETTHYTSIVSVDGWGKKIFCQGTSFVVNYPESHDVEKIGDILNALDEKEEILGIINKGIADRIKVYIGHEMQYESIHDCSLVVTPYKTREGMSGRVALLGPTRMNYERVVSTLDYVAELIEEVF